MVLDEAGLSALCDVIVVSARMPGNSIEGLIDIGKNGIIAKAGRKILQIGIGGIFFQSTSSSTKLNIGSETYLQAVLPPKHSAHQHPKASQLSTVLVDFQLMISITLRMR